MTITIVPFDDCVARGVVESVSSIRYRLHPIDVGFNLVAKKLSVAIDAADDPMVVSFADDDGDHMVMRGPQMEVLIALGKKGFQFRSDRMWDVYVGRWHEGCMVESSGADELLTKCFLRYIGRQAQVCVTSEGARPSPDPNHWMPVCEMPRQSDFIEWSTPGGHYQYAASVALAQGIIQPGQVITDLLAKAPTKAPGM